MAVWITYDGVGIQIAIRNWSSMKSLEFDKGALVFVWLGVMFLLFFLFRWVPTLDLTYLCWFWSVIWTILREKSDD